jgi:hypothetical protein
MIFSFAVVYSLFIFNGSRLGKKFLGVIISLFIRRVCMLFYCSDYASLRRWVSFSKNSILCLIWTLWSSRALMLSFVGMNSFVRVSSIFTILFEMLSIVLNWLFILSCSFSNLLFMLFENYCRVYCISLVRKLEIIFAFCCCLCSY